MNKHRRIGLVIIAFALAALAGPVLLMFRADRGDAAFGDSETLGVNRLSSATVEIGLGDQSVPLTAGNLAPGDIVLGSIAVTNKGTLPLRYAMTSDSDNSPMSGWLHWQVWAQADTSSCSFAQTTNTLLFDDELTSGNEIIPIFGDVLVGLDIDDRTLDPGQDEKLCVAVALSLDAPDEIQQMTVTQHFTIVAEQHTPEAS